MPLLKRARIEIYLPDKPQASYRRLIKACEKEFLQTFGGATVIKDIKGHYLLGRGKSETDKIVLIYADTPFDFDKNFKALSKYTDELRKAALESSNEESILIIVHEVYRSI